MDDEDEEDEEEEDITVGSPMIGELLHSRCHAHIANLLLKDLGKEFKIIPTIDSIKPVLKEFNKPKLAANLKSAGGNAIRMPFEVRWCSYRNTIQNYVDNLTHFKTLAAEIDSSAAKVLFDEAVTKACNDALVVLDPVCKLLNTCLKAETRLPHAVHMWMKLLQDATERTEPIIRKRIRKSKVFSDASLAAYLLDPRFRGELKHEDQIAIAEDYLIDKLDAKGLIALNNYRNNVGRRFSSLKDKVDLPNIKFWESAASESKELSDIALKIITIPAGTAKLEILFSNWGYIHNKTRNRLSKERSEKLSYIYYCNKVNNYESLNVDDELDEY